MNKEAMTLALEALNKLTDAAGGFSVSGVYFNEDVWEQECLNAAYDAIKALEEALAKQEQDKPVAWVCYGAVSNDIDFEQDDIDALPVGTMLYTTPQPAQKPWVGLTDEERDEIWADQKRTGESITRAIEVKLKEKNT